LSAPGDGGGVAHAASTSKNRDRPRFSMRRNTFYSVFARFMGCPPAGIFNRLVRLFNQEAEVGLDVSSMA
jgi:hypothetical protein